MANYQLARNSFKGKMNKDLDPIEIQNQEYIDALNAQFLSDSEGKTLNIMPVIGNTLAFDLGSVTPKNKKYRIYVPDTGNYEIKIYNIDGITPYDPNGIPVSPIVFSDLISLQVSIATSLSNSGISFIQTLNITDMYLEVELTENPYYDYIINSIGVDSVDIIISQEAIDPSMSGPKKVVGSNDLLGDLFIFSTTSDKIQEDVNIQSISNNGSGLIRVQTVGPHLLQDYEYVSIFGTVSGANGIWQINVIDSTRFDLLLSTFTSVSNTGTVSINIYGYGEIGVATYDLDLDSWTYVSLLRSKEFGFTTKRQVECDSEKNNLGKSLYFHQVKYNEPRVFYYSQKTYIQDGGLSINGGRYEYGNIDNELQSIISYTACSVKLLDQQPGGALQSGNKIYFVRLLTSNDSLAGTLWHGFSNIVSVYSASSSANPSDIIGDIDTICSKHNILEVSNIDFQSFKYIELGVAEYVGSAINGYIISRKEITGDTMQLTHFGNESDIRELSLEEVFQTTLRIKSVGSQTIIDNRMVYANISLKEVNDFSSFAKTLTHEILKEKVSNNGGSIQDIKYGGYQDPLIIHDKLGYTINETYRFGIQFTLKSGEKTPAFWIDDIKIDTNSSNISIPNRRTGAPSDYDLAPSVNELYIWYVRFGNFDINYPINGMKLKDVIQSFDIVRVDLDSNLFYREILLSGAGILSLIADYPYGNVLSGENPTWGNVAYGPNQTTIFPNTLKEDISTLYPFPFFSGQSLFWDQTLTDELNPSNINNYNYFTTPSSLFTASDPAKNYLLICSPDNIYDNYSISYSGGDKLIVYGNYKSSPYFSYPDPGYIIPYTKDFWCEGMGDPYIVDIDDSIFCDTGSSAYISGKKYFCNADIKYEVPGFPNPTLTVFEGIYSFIGGQVANTNIDLINTVGNSNTNEGIMFVQYYRPIFYNPNDPNDSKFGNIKNSVYVNTGASLYISDIISNSIQNIDVYGGDTFTCRTELRLNVNTQPDQSIIRGGSSAASFTTQSRVNFCMRAYSEDSSAPMWAKFPKDYTTWLNNPEVDQILYDTSYNSKYIKTYISYEKENELFVSELPTRIIYSNLKPQNSFSDAYRVFPPLQFKDLDPQYGEITHIENINDELFVWQPRNWQREFFNTTGILTSSDSDYIVMGNSGVMSRKGQRVSSYGTSNKWSVVKGRTRGGRDQVFWIDQENGTVLRFGADGTNTISLLWGMFSFFNNNLKWAGRFDTPAHGEGISGVWNERYQEAIYSVRGYRNTNSWIGGRDEFYNVGSVVNNGLIPIYGFPSIYVCIQEHTPTPVTEPGSGELWENYWELISTDNNNYYNLYSFVISEVKNGFTTFLTPKPLIYLPWKNKYLTPHPSEENSSKVYEENKGDYCVWYKVEDTEISENAHIESVININPMDVKTFVDILSQSEYKPYRVEFAIDLRDSNQNLVELRSYLVENDFEYKEGVWVSPVKNDTTTAPNGTPDEDTSQLYGNYIKVKLFMEKGKFQKLQNYLIKFQFNSRYNAT